MAPTLTGSRQGPHRRGGPHIRLQRNLGGRRRGEGRDEREERGNRRGEVMRGGGGGKEVECVKENKQGGKPSGNKWHEMEKGPDSMHPPPQHCANSMAFGHRLSIRVLTALLTESPPEDRFLLICKSIGPSSPTEKRGRAENLQSSPFSAAHQNSRSSHLNNDLSSRSVPRHQSPNTNLYSL